MMSCIYESWVKEVVQFFIIIIIKMCDQLMRFRINNKYYYLSSDTVHFFLIIFGLILYQLWFLENDLQLIMFQFVKPRRNFSIIKRDLQRLDSIGFTLIPQNTNIDFPEYKDLKYLKRRVEIGQMSKRHKMGRKIEEVNYTHEQHHSWRTLLARMAPLHQKVMNSVFLKHMAELEEMFQFSARIPRINDLSEYLHAKTGFLIKPVPGMISQRQFLECLSQRVFCSGQFIRHPLSLDFTVEPDVVHEFVGHVPMLADPIIAEISQKIGLLSLQASDEKLSMLGNVYLAILELGLCGQDGQVKVFGSGISACISDLQKVANKQFVSVDFHPDNFEKLRNVDYQKPFEQFYFNPTFEEALLNLNRFAESLDCQSAVSSSIGN